ncbi:MAG: hypothetical protein GY816_22135, partial [Cytophagales bacterium]|nr:hypothetical protein [Cytophagales bacterium]
FVIWDQNRKHIIIAKDLKGVKPLYYYYDNNELLLSSEAKGIFAIQRIPRSISNLYLTGPFLGSFPSSYSTFSNIHNLKSGHFLIVDHKGPQDEKPYWEQKYETDASLSFEDAKEGVRHLITQAVKRRMDADVPVGMCLSGGVDSTIVCGILANQGQNIKTFNLGFGGSIYDESEPARRTANHFGVEFETIDCQMDTLAEEFVKTLYHVEMALVNPAAIGRLKLSGLIRSQGYKVCMIGDGGDEQFCGYPYFKLEKLWRMILSGGDQAKAAKKLLKTFQTVEKRSEGLYWSRAGTSQLKEQLFGFPCYHQIRASEAQSRINQVFDSKKLGLKQDDGPYHIFTNSFNHEYLKSLDPINASRLISWNDGGYSGPAHGDRVEMANSVE